MLVVACALAVWWLDTPSPFVARQVKNSPLSEYEAPLLDLTRHVRFSARPTETFNFPIKQGQLGPVTPLYAGSLQYPFYCMTLDSKLGQPLVDNQAALGVPVYDSLDNLGNEKHVIGYSKDCSLPMQVTYAGEDAQGKLHFFNDKPAQGFAHYYRLEQGTINRFIYLMIMPITLADVGLPNKSSVWNQKLIYQFLGGSGIGFRQGKMRVQRNIERRIEQLHQGYAVITSTGNRTSYTYNMLLAEDTARRVKQQFIATYGQPEYTVGIGGSGGGLAQYLIGQNSTGILDAAIPLYSYPDMISQTLYALDCDLFNNYYAFRTDDSEFWQDWPNRILLEGLNAKNGEPHPSAFLEPLNQALQGRMPIYPRGNSECINGWFGLTAYIHNPAQGFLREFFANHVVDHTKWNYWEDMAGVFGRDKYGFANQTWSNEGIQYGLAALKQGKLSAEKFLHLNWHIGSWKPAEQMRPEKLLGTQASKKKMLWMSLWSNHNVTEASKNKPAARILANPQAVEMAYRSGQVFIGDITIPILDVRHYLEEDLDMHHSSASFVSRLRIEQAQGHHKNHVIWVADKAYSPINDAFKMMDQWLANIKSNPQYFSWQNKPEDLNDACFDDNGDIIASGNHVWDGEWNKQAEGKCHQAYTPFTNSRIAAGGPWQGSMFSCQLIPIDQAIAKGVYHPVDMSQHLEKLQLIFPNGVCDFTLGDNYRPTDL